MAWSYSQRITQDRFAFTGTCRWLFQKSTIVSSTWRREYIRRSVV